MMRKKILSLLLLVVGSLLIWIFWYWPDQFFHLIVCDVGQGDAIILSYGFNQVLIDAGPDEKILDCLSAYMPFWDHHLDSVIATHADADHIGGFARVFEQYSVGRVYLNPTQKNTDIYRNFLKSIGSQGLFPERLTAGSTISVFSPKEDVTFRVVWPEESEISDTENEDQLPKTKLYPTIKSILKVENEENDRSISGYIQYKAFQLLLTGDISSQSEVAIVARYLPEDVDVLKVPHHGSKSSTSEHLLNVVQPEVALLSYGKNNRFGHPHARVTDLLRSRNITMLETAISGHIEIISDGYRYWVE